MPRPYDCASDDEAGTNPRGIGRPCGIKIGITERPAGADILKVFWAKPSPVVQRTALPRIASRGLPAWTVPARLL
jgi:hypothetical protein